MNNNTSSPQSISNDLGISYSNALKHINHLIRIGYVERRKGCYRPLRLPNGKLMPIVSRKEKEALVEEYIANFGATKCKTVTLHGPSFEQRLTRTNTL